MHFKEWLIENKIYTYSEILRKQQVGNPYSDVLFSNVDAKFVEEQIHINKLRELNNLHEGEQTVSYFNELGLDEDETVSNRLMRLIINGIVLSPIVVNENYKVLDGSHRLAAYSELYYIRDWDRFNGILKIYKRIKN